MLTPRIKARGFWNPSQDDFFDVRVFHPNAPSYRNTSLSQLYHQHESDKKREYNERVREIEGGVFTPLVLSTLGGCGLEASNFYRRLAEFISRKEEKPYSITMNYIRCQLSFSIIRSAIMCLRGTRLSFKRLTINPSLAIAEGQIISDFD